jgi:monoamine oxidase
MPPNRPNATVLNHSTELPAHAQPRNEHPHRPWTSISAGRGRVAIIGGGPGGLITAYLLQKKVNRRLDIVIFEASERLGGKIRSPRFSLQPVTYEAGAAEFYDYSPVDDDPLKALIQELGLPLVKLGGSSLCVGSRVIANLDDVELCFGANTRATWQRFHQQARGIMSPTDFYSSGGEEAWSWPDPPTRSFADFLKDANIGALRPLLEWQIHSDLATEPASTNVEYGLQNYLMNDPAYMQLYGIEGGNERLIDELVRRSSASFRLQQPVTRIERLVGREFQVEFLAQDVPQSLPFDAVIVALPHAALAHLTFPDPLLAAAMQRHFDHHHHPAHYLRMSLLFRRPFWRAAWQESFCMLDHFDGCCLYDESWRTPEPDCGVLGWLLGGQAAVDFAQRPDDELIELALGSLPPMFGDGRCQFLEGRVHRWLNAVNALPGGHTALPIPQRHCPEPCRHDDLWIVGDYLYDSTINGVLDSADYVSDAIAAALHST